MSRRKNNKALALWTRLMPVMMIHHNTWLGSGPKSVILSFVTKARLPIDTGEVEKTSSMLTKCNNAHSWADQSRKTIPCSGGSAPGWGTNSGSSSGGKGKDDEVVVLRRLHIAAVNSYLGGSSSSSYMGEEGN
jgi:hypothetical protein